MSDSNNIVVRVRLRYQKGVSMKQTIAHVHEAIAKYKANLWPGDPFEDFTMADVLVLPYKRRGGIGYGVLVRENPDFPKYFSTLEEAEAFTKEHKGVYDMKVVALIAAELKH